MRNIRTYIFENIFIPLYMIYSWTGCQSLFSHPFSETLLQFVLAFEGHHDLDIRYFVTLAFFIPRILKCAVPDYEGLFIYCTGYFLMHCLYNSVVNLPILGNLLHLFFFCNFVSIILDPLPVKWRSTWNGHLIFFCLFSLISFSFVSGRVFQLHPNSCKHCLVLVWDDVRVVFGYTTIAALFVSSVVVMEKGWWDYPCRIRRGSGIAFL